MDIQKIKELALANGFLLKEQASGNMDLHSYVYEFAQAVAVEILNQAQLVYGQDGVTTFDTESLDNEISKISREFEAEYFFDNDDADRLEMLIAKSMRLGELYERQKWQAAKAQAQAVPEGFVLAPVKEIKTWYLDDVESIYREDPDWLCDISIGEVVEVEHRVSYELDQDPVFAAIQWDEENGDVGYYETFKSKAEAEKVAAHCKAMVEAQEPAND